MIARLQLSGVAGIADAVIDFDAQGVTELVGPSGSGKTTVIRAVCFVLWGGTPRGKAVDESSFVRSTAERAEVTATLANGATVRRTLTRGGTVHRYFTGKGGAEERFDSEKAFRARLGAIGNAGDLRYALVPKAWCVLAEGEGGGRPLRDLFQRLLPDAGPDALRAEVARLMAARGLELRPADSTDPDVAAGARTAANAAHERAKGRLEAARSSLVAAQAAVPGAQDAAELVTAEGVLREAEAHARATRARGDWERARDEAARASAALDGWNGRLRDLGKRPEPPDEKTIAAARKKLQDATASLAAANRERDDATAAIGRAEATLAGAEHAADKELDDARAARSGAERAVAELEAAGDACPTCARPGWEEAARRLVDARRRVTDATSAVAALEASAETRRNRRLANARAAVEETRKRLKVADDKAAAATERRAEAEREPVRLEEQRSAAVAWDNARRALGPAPDPKAVPPEVPVPGDAPRPDAVVAARAVVERATTARAAASVAQGNLRVAQGAVADAERALEAAAAEASRAEALVDATRRAPSEIARRQAQQLGELGPVSVEFPESGGCRVLVHGRSWESASDGELVVADVFLRMAIRRLLPAAPGKRGLPWLPLFIDNVNLWSGSWPGAAAPAVLLRTEPGTGLAARRMPRPTAATTTPAPSAQAGEAK